MAENKIIQPDSALSKDKLVIKPDARKLLIIQSIKVGFFAILFFVTIFGLLGFNPNSIATNIISFFGLTIGKFAFYGYFFGIMSLLLILVVALVEFRVEQVGCEFGDESLKLTKTNLVILTDVQEISYDKIVRVNVVQKDIFDKLFNTGKIVFELTATVEKEVSIEYISNTDYAVNLIQKKVNEYRMRRQAVFDEQNKIADIFKRGGY